MSTSSIISVIVAVVLITIVGLQSWQMTEMQSQLDDIKSNQSSEVTQTTEAAVTKPEDSAAITPEEQKSLVEVEAKANDPEEQISPVETESNNPEDQKIPQETESNDDFSANTAMDNPPSLLNDDFINRPFDANTWNPMAEIERMQRDIDRMFDRSYNNFNRRPDFDRRPDFRHHFRHNISSPKLDVREGKEGFTVILELQGLDAANISVTLDGRLLTVKGKQDVINQKQDSYGNQVFRQRSSGSFQRSITLPAPVRQNAMRTRAKDGVLIITIPKA